MKITSAAMQSSRSSNAFVRQQNQGEFIQVSQFIRDDNQMSRAILALRTSKEQAEAFHAGVLALVSKGIRLDRTLREMDDLACRTMKLFA